MHHFQMCIFLVSHGKIIALSADPRGQGARGRGAVAGRRVTRRGLSARRNPRRGKRDKPLLGSLAHKSYTPLRRVLPALSVDGACGLSRVSCGAIGVVVGVGGRCAHSPLCSFYFRAQFTASAALVRDGLAPAPAPSRARQSTATDNVLLGRSTGGWCALPPAAARLPSGVAWHLRDLATGAGPPPQAAYR
jgi:hypothetical protein